MVDYDSHIDVNSIKNLNAFKIQKHFLNTHAMRAWRGRILRAYIFDYTNTKSIFRSGVDWLFDTYLHINSVFKCGNMKIELTLSWEHLNYLYEKLNETFDCTHLWWNLSLECAVWFHIGWLLNFIFAYGAILCINAI